MLHPLSPCLPFPPLSCFPPGPSGPAQHLWLFFPFGHSPPNYLTCLVYFPRPCTAQTWGLAMAALPCSWTNAARGAVGQGRAWASGYSSLSSWRGDLYTSSSPTAFCNEEITQGLIALWPTKETTCSVFPAACRTMKYYFPLAARRLGELAPWGAHGLHNYLPQSCL